MFPLCVKATDALESITAFLLLFVFTWEDIVVLTPQFNSIEVTKYLLWSKYIEAFNMLCAVCHWQEERDAREMMKREQDLAYEVSLAADRAKVWQVDDGVWKMVGELRLLILTGRTQNMISSSRRWIILMPAYAYMVWTCWNMVPSQRL